VPDPTSDPEHAWPMDEGSPPGHACCGNWSAVFPSVPFGINSLNPNRDSPVKICSQLTRLQRQSATCARCSSVVLACSTAALLPVFQAPTRTECQTLATSFSPARCTSASTATPLRWRSCSTILAPSTFRHDIYMARLVFRFRHPNHLPLF
jgi:hypothetical protein